MSVGMIVSSIALGISLIVSALKLFDWLLSTDAATILRFVKRFIWILAITAVPCLVMLLVYERWTAAMLLGAAMLAVPAVLGWRFLVPRTKFKPAWKEGPPPDEAKRGDFGRAPPDPELVRRAAIVLEDYPIHAGYPEVAARIDGRGAPRRIGSPQDAMGADEALEVLGLRRGAKTVEIRAAHRRLSQLVHPDRGGTNYLSAKISRARDVLLAEAPKRAQPAKERGTK